jgi:hypothetical protein
MAEDSRSSAVNRQSDSNRATTGFVAYSSNPPLISTTIERAVAEVEHRLGRRRFDTWRDNDIAGKFIDQQVRDGIDSHDVLIADISAMNLNVSYEIGYAIGKEKRVLIIRNPAIAQTANINEIGIFDTLGWTLYQNSDDLSALFISPIDVSPISFDKHSINWNQPAYLIDSHHKTEWARLIHTRLNRARLSVRVFDPVEQVRLSSHEAIRNVASSLGVIVPLLPLSIEGSFVHNIRGSFLAGLADGMDRHLLLMQEGADPLPIDYRDYVRSYRHPGDINDFVGEFATEVFASLQDRSGAFAEVPKSFLESLDLGASSAENEHDLRHYYVETHEYNMALRGEGRLVLGRKGSGKSAIFAQVRDRARTDRQAIVLDLSPESFQLSKLREQVIDLLEEGTKEHTLTAFWEYLIKLELVARIIEQDRKAAIRDRHLFEAYNLLVDNYGEDEYVAEGDFSGRLAKLVSRISSEYKTLFDRQPERRLSHADVTRLLYSHNLRSLNEVIEGYMRLKSALWILFDNLDKGWSTGGITSTDLLIVRSLLEATRKIERSLRRHHVKCTTLVFLRNDVYELLVDKTPDRGKDGKIALDWTDPDMMREMLRRRFQYNGVDESEEFDHVWRQICVSHIHGEESSQYLIERSLMRPRCLLNLVNYCISVAVNLRHPKISESDISKGLETYSVDLITEIDFEIRDVFPEGENILYAFIGANAILNQKEIEDRLKDNGIGSLRIDRVIDVLLWFGVLGVVEGDGKIDYIYSVHYDMGLLNALRQRKKSGGGIAFHINPAFWEALRIRVQ